MTTLRHTARLLVFGVLVVLFSCGPDFDPYWKVNKFRLLAIKADPVTVDEGQLAHLEALVHDPAGEEVSYRWEWCPLRVSVQNRYACPVDAEQVNQMLREQNPDGQPIEIPEDFFDLGDQSTAQFRYPATRETIHGVCESVVDSIREAAEGSELAQQLPVLDCERGFEVSVRLVVTTPDDTIIARKRLLLATSDKTRKNRNPRLDAVEIQVQKAGDVDKLRPTLDWVGELEAPADDDWHRLSSAEPTPVVAGVPFKMRSVVDAASVDLWQPPAPKGSDRELLPEESEAVLFRWFVSGGNLSDSRGLYVEDKNALLSAGETVFSVSFDGSKADYDRDGVDNDDDNCAPLHNPDQRDTNGDGIGDGCDVYVWSVVRDGRLGLDYIERQVRVVDW